MNWPVNKTNNTVELICHKIKYLIYVLHFNFNMQFGCSATKQPSGITCCAMGFRCSVICGCTVAVRFPSNNALLH